MGRRQSVLLIPGLGGIYGFLMLVVVSFYGVLLLGFLPEWLTARLAIAGLKEDVSAWVLLAAGCCS
jgi:hypothetical protein